MIMKKWDLTPEGDCQSSQQRHALIAGKYVRRKRISAHYVNPSAGPGLSISSAVCVIPCIPHTRACVLRPLVHRFTQKVVLDVLGELGHLTAGFTSLTS